MANYSHHNSGRSWHLDRQKFNKNEDWEQPMRSRKLRYKSKRKPQEKKFLGIFEDGGMSGVGRENQIVKLDYETKRKNLEKRNEIFSYKDIQDVRKKFFDDILKIDYNGIDFYALGYSTASRGRTYNLDEAFEIKRKIESYFDKKGENILVFVMESPIPNFGVTTMDEWMSMPPSYVVMVNKIISEQEFLSIYESGGGVKRSRTQQAFGAFDFEQLERIFNVRLFGLDEEETENMLDELREEWDSMSEIERYDIIEEYGVKYSSGGGVGEMTKYYAEFGGNDKGLFLLKSNNPNLDEYRGDLEQIFYNKFEEIKQKFKQNKWDNSKYELENHLRAEKISDLEFNEFLKRGYKLKVYVDSNYEKDEQYSNGGGVGGSEKYLMLYNFVDDKMIEGDEVAEEMITKKGYALTFDELYDFVDEKMIEGDEEAKIILEKINSDKYSKGGGVGLKVSDLKKGDRLKKKGSALEVDVLEVGYDWRSGYDYAIIETPFGSPQNYIDVSNFVFSDGSPKPQYSKGGRAGKRRTKNYNYIPNRMIQSVEVKKGRKVTEIDGDNILDGVYVRGKVKFEGGGMTESDKENQVRNNLVDGRIEMNTLKEIIGCEPNYPNQIIGSIKLKKCFLLPYYRLA